MSSGLKPPPSVALGPGESHGGLVQMIYLPLCSPKTQVMLLQIASKPLIILVDGRNPAPPWMHETLVNNGIFDQNPVSTGDGGISEPSTGGSL